MVQTVPIMTAPIFDMVSSSVRDMNANAPPMGEFTCIASITLFIDSQNILVVSFLSVFLSRSFGVDFLPVNCSGFRGVARFSYVSMLLIPTSWPLVGQLHPFYY
jgi:hypothetical protein